ncbi:hypothetical protein CRG98_039005 [Punica granatum]|uniref:Uncharacterized protein n=1 Tax=Punica granatum TaxID=22663 RepID=A0A2I0I9A5_PUNGR|nr:hypothetical protein CRG98_039005 [Punica granatum]
MAFPHKLVAPSLVFLLFVASSESSRLLLKDCSRHSRMARAKPALNLALPGDSNVIAFPSAKPRPSPEGDRPKHAFPSFGRKSGAGAAASSSGRSFRQMFLNALPKGPVTPSGPSKGTNRTKLKDLRD